MATAAKASLLAELNIKLTAPERISKVRIELNKETPFFSYLVAHLNIQNRAEVKTMGVDARNNCYYNEAFINSLDIEELKGLIVHEVMHVAMYHPRRGKGRDVVVGGVALWNVACDAWVNDLLLRNKFKLPKEGIIPQNGTLVMGSAVVTDIPNKSVEEIYEELKAALRKGGGKGKGKGKGKQQDPNGNGGGGNGDPSDDDSDGSSRGVKNGLDEHMWDKPDDNNPNDGKDGEGSDGDKGQPSNMNRVKDWGKILSNAHTHAKLIGKEPLGIAREFGNLYKSRVNWKVLLRKAISSRIPSDYTYARPSKKLFGAQISMGQEIYLPSTTGEKVKVICAIDTSGSISDDELKLFMSEIIGIHRSFVEVDFWIMFHDTEVHNPVVLTAANERQLLAVKPAGFGGTSHLKLYEHIREKRWDKETKLFISFTDGYSQFPTKKPTVETIFVLGGRHEAPSKMPKWSDTVICLD